VIEGERLLQAVDGGVPLGDEDAGVIDQYVQAVVARLEVRRHATHLLLRGEIRHDELAPPFPGGLDLGQCSPSLLGIARHEDDARPLGGERDGRGLAYSLIGARDEDGLSLHVDSFDGARRRPVAGAPRPPAAPSRMSLLRRGG